ncbi:hypothetical protein [Microbacterium sp. USTB-Y]|uniref:hypothetical protein n=1 Tax=Microbacterium sp. USTB-Y TaxID=2823692 RepID=UPI002040AB87|nr:hypothetical protein [Microbacterium sp. USTB-Y]
MTDAQFSYDPATRTLRGILLPFGERSRPNITGNEGVMFSADSIDLPRDPSVVTLNRNHNRYDPIGRATFLEKRREGVYAEFAVAQTDQGDDYLRNPGTLRKLSAEVADMVTDAANVVRSRLTGAALAPAGAFPSAGLFALEEDIAASDQAATTSEHVENEYTDENGITWRRVMDIETETTDTDAGSTTTTTITETTENTDQAGQPVTEGAFAMTNIVPDGAAAQTAPKRTLDGLFAAIARQDPDALRNYSDAGELFALSTIQQSGPSTVTIGADVQQAGYLGELWLRAAYNRRFVPLVGNAALTNYQMIGWTWDLAKLPVVADYTGNTDEVPSNAVDTKPVKIDAARLANGMRLDRRYQDFNDQAVVASFLTQQTESYKRVSDGKVLAGLKAGATVTAPGAVPAGIPKGLAALVDGALDVIANENRPSFALMSPELWRDTILMSDKDKLAFLNAGFGLEEGDLASFHILPANVGTGKVIVGAKEAYTYYELSDTPIRVEGVVPGNGATDVAVFGYWAQNVNNAAALRVVTVA